MDIYSKNDLLRMSYKEVATYFNTLPAPSLEEMDGEFMATALAQSNHFNVILASIMVNLRARWLGKAFHPVSERQGEGYNFFHDGSGILRALRMGTYIKPSGITHGDSYHVDYSVFHKIIIIRSGRDEIRKIADGLYLGIGRFTYSKKAGRKYSPFILEGPSAKYHIV